MIDRTTLSYYEKNSDLLVERYETAEVSLLHQRIIDTFTATSTVLEIGCGSGREAAFLLQQGYDVYCIDGSENMIRAAIQNHPDLNDRISRCVLPEELNFERTFDGIISIAVLMHFQISEIQKIMARINLLLRPKGRLFFSVPLTRPDLKESGFDSSGRFFLLLPENDWLKLVNSSGFSVINTFSVTDGLGRKDITWFTCIAEKPA